MNVDRKLFAQAAEITRKISGRNEHLNLSVIQACGEQLEFFCPTSLEAFKEMPLARRRTARGAVKSALKLGCLPTDEQAYGTLSNLRGDCKVPERISDPARMHLNRLFQYVSSTVVE